MPRGGARGGGGLGRMNGQPLPFEVDAALESEVAAFHEGNPADDEDEEDWVKEMYPPVPVRMARPLTESEKFDVEIARVVHKSFRDSPLFLGDEPPHKRSLAEFDAFENAETYGNKKKKGNESLPNLKDLGIDKRFLPKELWCVVSDGEESQSYNPFKAKPLARRKKKRNPESRRFENLREFEEKEAARSKAIADGTFDAAKDLKEAEEDENEDDDGIEEPKDDDFDEDEDDAGNDYNAEKYFDDGDGGDDDHGGDDGGDEW